MRAHITAILFVAAIGGCYASTGVGYHAGYVGPAPVYTQPVATVSVQTYEPDLVDVGGGVQVIADYDEPVFYTDNFYWRFYGGSWYRSNVHTGGWSVYNDVPYSVRRIDRPQGYVRYRPQGYVPRDRRDNRQPYRDNRQPEVRDHRQPGYQPVRDQRQPYQPAQPDVRDHRQPVQQPYQPAQPDVRDHRQPVQQPYQPAQPDVRDHRQPVQQPYQPAQPDVRDHRTAPAPRDTRPTPAPAPTTRDQRTNGRDDRRDDRRNTRDHR